MPDIINTLLGGWGPALVWTVVGLWSVIALTGVATLGWACWSTRRSGS
jgi:uncharacterized membrane protein YccF (DUF307 family)